MPSDQVADMTIPAVEGYRVERTLGTGAHAVVLAAVSRDGRRVALKIAKARDAVAERQLAHEKAVLETIRPPAAPEVIAFGKLADGSSYLTLELLPPPTLAQYLRSLTRPLHPGQFRKLAV